MYLWLSLDLRFTCGKHVKCTFLKKTPKENWQTSFQVDSASLCVVCFISLSHTDRRTWLQTPKQSCRQLTHIHKLASEAKTISRTLTHAFTNALRYQNAFTYAHTFVNDKKLRSRHVQTHHNRKAASIVLQQNRNANSIYLSHYVPRLIYLSLYVSIDSFTLLLSSFTFTPSLICLLSFLPLFPLSISLLPSLPPSPFQGNRANTV